MNNLSVFEIALVRLSETSDYLHGQVNNPLAVIRRSSDKLQPDFICPVMNRPNSRNSCPDSVRAAIVTMLLLTSAQMPLMLIQSVPPRSGGPSQDIL